jgi:hypothetical protein
LNTEACFKKSASFSSENEYRIVAVTAYSAFSQMRYRTSRSCLIPYLVVEIPRHETGHDKDPDYPDTESPSENRYQFIKRVVVGPSPNMDLTLQAARAFFYTMRIGAHVVPSQVSFRDW